MFKPLSEPGVPFTVPITVDHNVTSLFVLPEGPFYTVESLVLDAVTGIPLKPVVDYMYFQQDYVNAKITSKQIAAIIQIRNKDITEVVVKGKYSHGVTDEEVDQWKALTISHKDVPKWMNWLACLDDELQVHPNVKRIVTEPPMDKRTLSDVEVEINMIADQFLNGDSLYLSHIEYWQQQLFLMAENKYKQMIEDLNSVLNKMKGDTGSKVGDFKFTDGDGVKWSGGLKNQFHGITLRDRGAEANATYAFLPEGSAIPARRTNLFQRVAKEQKITGKITTDKSNYFGTDKVNVTVNITELVNRDTPLASVQILDPLDERLLADFKIQDLITGTYKFSYDLSNADIGEAKKELIVRIPEYMWLEPVIITVEPRSDPGIGYVHAELLGNNHIGANDGGGYVDEIVVKFKRVGILREPQTLYVHLSGDYTDKDIQAGYPKLQTFKFPVTFNESEEIVAKFVQQGNESGFVIASVDVSKSPDPDDILSIVASNTWYITKVPANPYISWHFAKKEGDKYTRVGSIEEGTEVYCVGTLSVAPEFYPVIPQLVISSAGVGSAIEGVDFVIDRGDLINIDDDRVAYRVILPFKPEQEVKYKFLRVHTINSNTAELWIVDVIGESDITSYWSEKSITSAPPISWVEEDSTFYLHVKVKGIADGTKLNVSLVTPESLRNYLTFDPTITIYGGMGLLELKLGDVGISKPEYIKLLITGPNIYYNTLALGVTVRGT